VLRLLVKDTALVLSRFNSIILARVYAHQDVQELAELSSVPVINALSEKYHPLQMLADYMTVKVRLYAASQPRSSLFLTRPELGFAGALWQARGAHVLLGGRRQQRAARLHASGPESRYGVPKPAQRLKNMDTRATHSYHLWRTPICRR
jgi:aspartate carbamoyltransferase catalytic subunit